MTACVTFQSTRPLRGETCEIDITINIKSHFQSTRPLRGETARMGEICTSVAFFNPLAPCGARRSDSWYVRWTRLFNPLAPCGARRQSTGYTVSCKAFQSTRPLRGETKPKRTPAPCRVLFNPLAPCGARHIYRHNAHPGAAFFNPLAPCGARQDFPLLKIAACWFSIHSPLAGRDGPLFLFLGLEWFFNPLAPCGARADCVVILKN